MTSKVRSISNSRRLVVLLVLSGITSAVGAIAVISYQVVREIILNNLKQQSVLEVSRGSSEIDEWLAVRKAEVVTLANSPIVQSLDWSKADSYLAAEASRLEEFFFFALAEANGSYWTTKIGRADGNVSDRDWFIQTLTGQTAVNDPIVSRTTEEVIVPISAPVSSLQNDQVIGALSGSIQINRLLEVTSSLEQGTGSYAFALNSEGVPIVHPDSTLIGTPEKTAPSLLQSTNSDLAAIAQRMVNQQAGIELAFIDDRWQYVAYAPLNQADWSIALVIPRENIESNLRALNILAAVIGGLLAIAIMGAWRQVQSYEKTRTHAAQEALLNRLTTRIRESLELQAIVQTTIMELVNLGAIDRALFGWYNPTAQLLDLVHVSDQLHEIRGCSFDAENLEARLLKQETIRLISTSDTENCPSLELHTNCYIALPIPAQDDRIGYLIAVFSKPLSESDQELLHDIATQLAIAIRQAHLYSQTQTQVKLLNQTLAELQKTQTQLVQSEKMSSLGQLVAGVAHEINNPVNFIYGNLTHAKEYANDLLELVELYQQEYPQPSPVIQEKSEDIDLDFLSTDLPKLLSSIQVGAERIREIVKSLRIFSRLDEAEFKAVDLHQGIDSTLMILQNRLKSKPDQPEIEVIREYGDLPLVECYAGQLNQVFMNILSNAIDALDEVITRPSSHETNGNGQSAPTLTLQKPRICITTTVVSKNQVAIRIADNGPGVPEEVRDRLFDPFFTTKPVGKGTGMGLAISYEIITQKHNGVLKCHSAPNQGTEFVVEIPIRQTSQQFSS